MKVVRIINHDDKPFVGRFDGERFTIPPQSDTLVPYGAMVLWMGDPAARNLDERRRHRVVEEKRLRTKYGAYEDQDKFEVNKPKLEAHTLDGELIPTVLTDPEGLLAAADLSESTEENAMRRELMDLRSKMGRIEEMLSTGALQVVAPGDAAPGPEIPVASVISSPDDSPVIDPGYVETNEHTNEHGDDFDPSADTTPPVDEPQRVRVGNRSRPRTK